MSYDHKKIEQKWAKKWTKDKIYQTKENKNKPKYYILDMFPYPSGVGLHVGHPKGYIATDAFARMKMMQDYNVLHPMGWDAFGLPAENFAIKNKVHPRVAVEKNIETFKNQLGKLGFSYDWDREIDTTDPKFYKWTQWIFLQLYKKGLAYESYEPINWCPSCQTGLANEDLEDGKCERCGSEIERKPMRQWVLKITDYADRMLNDLEKLPEWDESIKEMQKNWIGRSEGAEVEFVIASGAKQSNKSAHNPSQERNTDRHVVVPPPRDDKENKIKVFTTRPDTLFGATYMVLSPEHELVDKITTKEQKKEVEKYKKQAAKKSDLERTELQKDKTGVFTGAYAINLVNNEEIPIWIADYVLMDYGTGAIMAVPAHDERDWEFAKKYDIPIKEVVAPYQQFDSRDDKETEDREVVTAVVKNPKNNKFLCLKWKTTDWQSFPSGGRDGEDMVEAARREILEETGYKNLKFIRQIGDSVFADYYRPHKDSNVNSHFRYFYFELENEEQDEVDEEEKKQHEYIWVDEDKVGSFINVWNQEFLWKRFQEGYMVYAEDGKAINSEFLDNLTTKEAKETMIKWLEKNKVGKRAVNYKLKDWVFSRQRYWGEPIPIIHCEKCGIVPVPEKDLPVELPEVENYEPSGTGESPLAGIDDWVNTECPKCGGPAKRETNTMPQWAGSSWYYLRFIDPNNDKALVDKQKEKYWSPVDFYVGGAEHATRHLIYARFWHKFLYDIGAVNYEEPFTRLQHVGLILAEDGRKMSKRWGNVINPDDIVEKYGADALRVYEMFMGPFSQSVAWNTNGLVGARKFLDKVHGLQFKVDNNFENSKETITLLHKTIKKVSQDIEEFKFNTAVSAMMILINKLTGEERILKELYEKFLLILAPFAPHLAEEIWEQLGHKKSIFKQNWPEYDEKLAKDKEIELVVQVNGKVRDRIKVSADIKENQAKSLALESEQAKRWVEDKEVVKVIFVPGKLINVVVK